MHLRTASVAREVDRWKDAVVERYRRFVASLHFLLIAVGHRRQVVLPILLTIGLSVRFAALECVSLAILGGLLLKLHSYRLANIILKSVL